MNINAIWAKGRWSSADVEDWVQRYMTLIYQINLNPN